MNRRQFLRCLRSPAPSILEVRGQSFYMNFVDARVDHVEGQFLEEFRQRLRTVAHLVINQSVWLRRSDLQPFLEPILKEYRASGGQIRYV